MTVIFSNKKFKFNTLEPLNHEKKAAPVLILLIQYSFLTAQIDEKLKNDIYTLR
jgi:hypothetical protein